ncbi:MAG: APC family permease [Sphingomonadaceae bacterium]|nr:APC family permease [Thermaurantiacus sp.]MCS6987832.1 APC family permease [Sphingomonadaceae bacterium]MDW8414948.1 APC family permease [Thermaurantiacus sp.]
MVAGIVIGAGIFRIPTDVARLVPSEPLILSLWLAGAVIALAGAATYSALARVAGDLGGEYRFLALGFGPAVATLFVWARMTVIQTGSIAAVAFVAGEHAARLVPLPPALLALLAVAGVTVLNWSGLVVSARLQRGLVVAVVLALAGLVALGLAMPAAHAPPAAPTVPPTPGAVGLALVFVMLAYGGWNEAAYLAGETQRGARTLAWGLAGGLLLVAALYLGFNAAALHALGVAGLAATPTPAVALTDAAGGAGAGVAVLVLLAALSTLNVTVLTGARAMCALGRDHPAFRALGAWDQARAVPRASLLVQAAIALALVGLGWCARDGFEAMVAFTAPVFWLFLALVGLVPFRRPELARSRPAAGLFAVACLGMAASAVDHARGLALAHETAGWMGLAGLGCVALGLPVSRWRWRAGAGSGRARP